MPTSTSAPDTSSVDVTSGEYVCSACRGSWRHGGGPLRHDPVQDGPWTPDPRRWHPCPACLQSNPVLAGFDHGLRQRTAADLRGWAERVDAQCGETLSRA